MNRNFIDRTYVSSFNRNRSNYTSQILDEIANLTDLTAAEDGNTAVADVLNSCLAPNDTCNVGNLQLILHDVQPIIQCAIDLVGNYTFGNPYENVAIESLITFNRTAFDAVNQSDCLLL